MASKDAIATNGNISRIAFTWGYHKLILYVCESAIGFVVRPITNVNTLIFGYFRSSQPIKKLATQKSHQKPKLRDSCSQFLFICFVSSRVSVISHRDAEGKLAPTQHLSTFAVFYITGK
jgi:hypothetical protein